MVGTNSRNFHINRPATTGATGGIISVTHTDGSGLNTISTVTDGAYNINRQSAANWTVSTSGGFAAGTGTFSYAISGQGAYISVNGNNRIMKISTVVGTNQTGTSLPHAQRIGIAAADYTGTFYLGLDVAEMPVTATTSGAWETGTNWDNGTGPVCGSNVVIPNGIAMTVSTGTSNCGTLTIKSGGSLTISANTLNVGCTNYNNYLNNSGTLTINGGNLNVNGNIFNATGSTFSQSGGTITIDGNNAGSTTGSVASGTPLLGFGTSSASFATGSVSLTGGSIIIKDPHTATPNTSAYAIYGYFASSVYFNSTTSHTIQFGDGSSSDAGGNTSGFYFNTFVSAIGRLNFGNITVNNPSGSNRNVTQTGTNAMNGNLTVTAGTYDQNSTTTNIGGNISIATGATMIASGTTVFCLTTGSATSAQTTAQSVSVAGTGVINNLSASPTANFTSVTFNNTSSTGVTLNALNNNSGAAGFTGASASVTITFTAGIVTTTGGNALLWGTSTARGTGSLTVTSGGMTSGSTFAIGTTAGQTGTTITTGAEPTFSSGGYPFVDASGNKRYFWIQRVTASGAGIIGVTYNDIAGTSTVSIVDGAYTVDKQYNSTWSVNTFGTTPTATTFNIAMSATNAFGGTLTNANSRITTLSGVLGTYQAGTTLPHAQRTALTLANLTGQAFYLGVNNSDIAFVAIATGNWEDGSTWNKGTAPTGTDNVTIASPYTVTINAASASANAITINSGGTLTVSGSTLSINTSLTNSGTVNVNGGSLTTTTSLTNNASSNVNVSSGSLNVTTTMTNTGTFTLSGGTTNITGASTTGLTNTGTLTASSGTLNIGPSGGSNRTLSFTAGALTISGGTINLNGNMIHSGGTFTMSSGNLNIDGNDNSSGGSVASGTALFAISVATSSVTGGTITFVDPPFTGTGLTLSYSVGSTNVDWVGNTLVLGDGASSNSSTATNGFNIDCYVSTGRLKLGNVTVNGGSGTSRFTSGTTASGNDFIVGGTFTINSGSEFRQVGTGSSSISGNIVNNGTFTTINTLRLAINSSTAGTVAQTISGSGVFQNALTSPTANFANLLVNNTGGVTISSLSSTGTGNVSGTLTMTAGNIDYGSNVFSLGTTSAAGTLSYTAGKIIGSGGFRQYVTGTSTYTFPIGTATLDRKVTLQYTVAPTAGTLLAVYSASDPVTTNAAALSDAGPYSVDRYSAEGYWTFTASSLAGGTYNISLNTAGMTGVNTISALRLIKRSGSGVDWSLDGTHTAGSGTTASRTGITTGFSQYGIGGNTTDNPLNAPLPVVLSSFTSSIKDRNVVLSWKTEKEINNSGFDVERRLVGTNEWKKTGFVAGKGNTNSPANYTFEDKKLNSGKYNYRLKQIDFNGNFEYYNLSTTIDVSLPTKFNLSQNYPNPFNPTTKIDFDLPFDSKVSIILYDMTGREVKTLVNEGKTAGYYTVQFNASDLSSGTYFYRIITKSADKDFVATKKMVLIK